MPRIVVQSIVLPYDSEQLWNAPAVHEIIDSILNHQNLVLFSLKYVHTVSYI